MKADKLYVNFMIDCESTQRSINDSAFGERSARGFMKILEDHGLKGTFYLISTDAAASPAFYKELRDRGHQVGLHIHPSEEGEFEEFLGIYGPEEQNRILTLARDRFAQALSFQPKGICIGYISTNDHTYGVLSTMGFTHGVASLPSRVLPECVSVHAGAPLDIHYAHPYNRILPGNLDFVEIPLTVDIESRMWGGRHPQDLRVELVDSKNHWYTINKAIKRQIEDQVPIPYLQVNTHNTFDYDVPGDFRRKTLEEIIVHIRNLAEQHELEVISSTNEETAASYRRIVPLPENLERFELDRRGYLATKDSQ